MILIPTLSDGETGREQVVRTFAKPKENRPFGVVGLCASGRAAELWREAGADVAETDTINAYVQQLLNRPYDNALCVINRYDGIHLPHKDTRILILGSNPISGNL